jgi:hypothetical protein
LIFRGTTLWSGCAVGRASKSTSGQSDPPKQHEQAAATLLQAFHELVDRHGYGLQHALIREAKRLHAEGKSPWEFEASEFPVELRSNGTRIDFILHRRQGSFLMLSECKRVNPAFGDWCFLSVRGVRRGREDEPQIFEHVLYKPPEFREGVLHDTRAVGIRLGLLERAYHLGFDVKGAASGDPSPKGARGEAVEEALGQVRHPFDRRQRPRRDVPSPQVRGRQIGVTGPQVGRSEDDRHQSKATSLANDVRVRVQVFHHPTDLPAYQYHMSPGLMHDVPPPYRQPFELGPLLDAESVRTVYIVSSRAFESFLCDGPQFAGLQQLPIEK